MGNRAIVLFVVSCAVHFQDLSAFLLQGSCSVRPPCYCAGDTLYCSSLGLTNVPTFYSTHLKVPYLRVKLNNNHIRNIPRNAFSQLGPANGTFIKISLSSNYICYIDDDAFFGIENEVGSLDLTDNELLKLPRAIGKLKNLQNLFLLRNRLTSLDPLVVQGISNSLHKLQLSLEYIHSWPKEISIFAALVSLRIDIYDVHMDDDALSGSLNTLKRLHIVDSSYDYISPAVCRLQVLDNLLFNYVGHGHNNAGKNATSHQDFLPCTVDTLEYFYLESSSSFTSNMFSQLPSLKVFQLVRPEPGHNKIENRHIPLNSSLTTLHLNGCRYRNIPGAVNVFSHLEELDMNGNLINSVGEYDLTGLRKLQTLILENNPITYISPNAFATNNNLQVLNLVSTNIDAIPVAITTLQSLQILHLRNTAITCDCNSLSNVTSWNIQGITVTGLCDESDPDNSEMIKTYVLTTLQRCP